MVPRKPRKSARSRVNAASPKAIPQLISPGQEQAKETSQQKIGETREEIKEAEKKRNRKKAGTSKYDKATKAAENNKAQVQEQPQKIVEEEEIVERI